jgi:hypothetical protein
MPITRSSLWGNSFQRKQSRPPCRRTGHLFDAGKNLLRRNPAVVPLARYFRHPQFAPIRTGESAIDEEHAVQRERDLFHRPAVAIPTAAETHTSACPDLVGRAGPYIAVVTHLIAIAVQISLGSGQNDIPISVDFQQILRNPKRMK